MTTSVWPTSARATGRATSAYRPRRGLAMGDVFLRWHAWLLLGYAVAGKGFAYLGLGPLYVGELTLLLGLVVATTTGAILRIPRSPTTLLLLALLAWTTARTLPGLSQYGAEALRDSVICTYGLFALLVAGVLASRPERLAWLIGQYGRFAKAFLLLIPAVWLLSTVFREALPQVPGTDVPVLYVKPGDILVHLAGIGAYQLVGLGPSSLLMLLLLSTAFALTAVRTRAGFLAFVIALAFTAAARPLRRRVWMAGGGVTIAVAMLLYANLELSVSGRELSARQFVTSASSILGDGPSDLDGPKQWRLQWWSKIGDYTLLGPHRWLGKGFGVNLATEDGFDVDDGRTLRSPHNGHLTVLARAGVPGFLLWALVQLSWLWEMGRHYRRSRRECQRRWSQLFLALIAYWLAFLINATFDVALEGPMAGIWFWTLFGVGLAAVRIHKRWPDALDASPPGARLLAGACLAPDLPKRGARA